LVVIGHILAREGGIMRHVEWWGGWAFGGLAAAGAWVCGATAADALGRGAVSVAAVFLVGVVLASGVSAWLLGNVGWELVRRVRGG
jgi:hypothetical protein